MKEREREGVFTYLPSKVEVIIVGKKIDFSLQMYLFIKPI
jgi:hypothetical protein